MSRRVGFALKTLKIALEIKQALPEIHEKSKPGNEKPLDKSRGYRGRSLVDWDMSSDRNNSERRKFNIISLVDWDMSSDRN